MKNRWIVTVSIIAVVVGMLSACGAPKETPEDVPQVPSSRGPSAPPKVSKPTTPLPR